MSELTTSTSKLKTMKDALMRGSDSMRLVLPPTINPDSLIRYALTAAQNNPELFQCPVNSVGLALMNAASLGLEPNGRDGHLVPYNDKKSGGKICQFIPDYKGYIKLMFQNPDLQNISAYAVRENDDFDYELGSKRFLHHKPPVVGIRGELIAAWAMYTTRDGSGNFVVLTQDEVNQHRNASPSKNSFKSPWKLWEDSMWAKTAVRVLQKFAPLGPGIESISMYEEQVDLGTLSKDTILNDPDKPAIEFEGPTDSPKENPETNSQKITEKVNQRKANTSGSPTGKKPLERNALYEGLEIAIGSGNLGMIEQFEVQLQRSLDEKKIGEDESYQMLAKCAEHREQLRAE